MVQVLVVDDEKEIRNGLVTQIPWADWGIDEVYHADDGDTALELALLRSPDLIVTDIRMPRMSGLQLVEELFRNGYAGSIIVISGYDDFHFAKEAFKLGVSDYLLKPIDKEELSRAVAVSLHRMRELDRQEQNQNLFRQNFEQALPKMREETLQELIEKPHHEGLGLRIENKLGQLKLDWLISVQLRLIVIGIDDLKALTEKKPPGEKELILFAVGNILEHMFNEYQVDHYVLFRSKQDNWIALFASGPVFDSFNKLEAFSAAVCEHVKNNTKIHIQIGISQETGVLGRLYDMHQQAVESLVYLKVHGNRPEIEEGEFSGTGGINLANTKELVEQLKYGTATDICEAMDNYPKLVKSWNIHHPKDLQQYTFEWLLELFRTAQKMGWKESSWEKNPIAIWEHLERFDTLESLQQQITVQLLQTAESMKGQFGSLSQIVYEAQCFIQQRFNENLTLQMVADHVHVTPVWLSKLFKKESGMNYLEYLTEIRLNKAAELLMDLNHKVYQVSFLVGYQDPVHFSRLFKKKFSCTPQEYRNNRGNQVE